MSPAGLAALTSDIKANGLKQPITTCDGMVLDGRARLLACQSAGVEPKFELLKDGTDPVSWVISQNLHRRHLAPSQRAAIAVEALPFYEKEAKERQKLSWGRGHKGSAIMRDLNCGKATHHAAEAFGVSSRLIEYAKGLKTKAPDMFEAVRRGEKTTAEAKIELEKRDYIQRVLAANANPDPASIRGPFDIIVADPPWEGSPIGVPDRSIQNHYSTLSVEEICKLKPNAKPDSVLFLWTTGRMRLSAEKVINAWGFAFVTEAIWDKKIRGTGNWILNQHEIVLIAKRGNFKPPVPSLRVSSVFRERRRNHSRKPECFYQWVEKAFPGTQKFEMYCRHPRPGWSVWGNEISPSSVAPESTPFNTAHEHCRSR